MNKPYTTGQNTDELYTLKGDMTCKYCKDGTVIEGWGKSIFCIYFKGKEIYKTDVLDLDTLMQMTKMLNEAYLKGKES